MVNERDDYARTKKFKIKFLHATIADLDVKIAVINIWKNILVINFHSIAVIKLHELYP